MCVCVWGGRKWKRRGVPGGGRDEVVSVTGYERAAVSCTVRTREPRKPSPSFPLFAFVLLGQSNRSRAPPLPLPDYPICSFTTHHGSPGTTAGRESTGPTITSWGHREGGRRPSCEAVGCQARRPMVIRGGGLVPPQRRRLGPAAQALWEEARDNSHCCHESPPCVGE